MPASGERGGSSRPVPNAERNAKIIALRKEGVGPREIARRMGISNGVVSGVLNRACLTSRDNWCGAPLARAARTAISDQMRIHWARRREAQAHA